MASLITTGLFSLTDWITGAFGLLHGPFSAKDMLDRAQQRTRLTDFGDSSFEQPLEVLLKAYHEEANLNLLGRLAARWDTLRFLTNLLMLRQAEKIAPEILAQPIERPIFITGLPRSGTTFLHSLLALDPSNLAPLCWETIYPYRDPGRPPAKPDRRPARVDRQLAAFVRMVPELPSLHPMSAHSPQECIEIQAHVFRSYRFDTTHNVPSYRSWLDQTDHEIEYRFHRRFLRHLQHSKGPGRWVLKSPDHIFMMDAIRAVYPDARMVFVHREPMEVLPSAARLTELLRRPFTRAIDRLQIGREVMERWQMGALRLIAEAERDRQSRRIFHIRYRDLTADPLGAAVELYHHFGLKLGDLARARIRDYLAERPYGGYGQNSYHPEDFGLDPKVQWQRFGEYRDYFGIEGKKEAARGPGRFRGGFARFTAPKATTAS
jgi:hypothetical protein